MARLILKSPYLKCDGSHSVSGYLRYIGTRERVESSRMTAPHQKAGAVGQKTGERFPFIQKIGRVF